ncbi:2,3-diaminopropionate biosynthesis protein SbnB [Salinisphaera sp. RV14]|uniref:2,3-diaminopropionate biosynthesis protein SbnB n=1 Tax=Salinisphaera sp. RV14 TaxID=3454140 RepID=UPI003F83FBE0
MLRVIKGPQITRFLANDPHAVVDTVRQTYLLHKHGRTNNPDSYFLTFPDNQQNRIIVLPASIASDDVQIAGLKWIASYPANIEQNLQRASATLLLNDYSTGYPIACLEASQISAHRTAASGAVAVQGLSRGERCFETAAFIGCGVLAQKTLEYLRLLDLSIKRLAAFDQVDDYASHFATRNHDRRLHCNVADSIQEAFRADLIVCATTASEPYITLDEIELDRQVVLNISLRDLDTDIIEASNNIVDDVDHCLKAQTSCHLTEQKLKSRSFIDGEIADVLDGSYVDDPSLPTVISPFGLGVLDIALGHRLYTALYQDTDTVGVPDFLPSMQRL